MHTSAMHTSAPQTNQCAEPLKIIHIFRAPLGGLFRHVIDLIREQSRLGFSVGIICDANTGGPQELLMLKQLRPYLTLGILRVSMHRNPDPTDVIALLKIAKHIRNLKPHILHGHGSKGGFYARLHGIFVKSGPLRVYTPHGGSFNYNPGSPLHRFYMGCEAMLQHGTNVYLFESQYIADRFIEYVGPPKCTAHIVWNGISSWEFQSIEKVIHPVDFLYIGELRAAKGIDTLLNALLILKRDRNLLVKTILAGTGPERNHLMNHVRAYGLEEDVDFIGTVKAREAFKKAHILVVPSRAESLPYVVLEAAGARMNMIATNVGGIPEIFGPLKHCLINPNNPIVLADAMEAALSEPKQLRDNRIETLGCYVEENFTIPRMAAAVLNGYQNGLRQISRHQTISHKIKSFLVR